ncbi:MAG: amidohydrolase family protein [Ferruginibacter sp.]
MPTKKISVKILQLTLLVCFFSSCKFRQKIDLLVLHAKIYTVDKQFDTAEAMAINDGKIIAVGKNEDIQKEYEAAEEINASGKFIYPGFIDAHAHFFNYGQTLNEVNLVDTKSWDDCIERIKTFVKEKKLTPGQWLQGRGWDQNDWDIKEYPEKKMLDSLFPDNPVIFGRIDGHAAIANQAALDKAGIKPNQKAAGGNIETKNNQLTGILIDNAVDLVSSVIPDATKEELSEGLMAAQKNCFAVGLTTVFDCGLLKKNIDLIDELQKAGQLKMRIDAMLTDSSVNYDYYLQHGPYKTDRLNVSSFKLYADGALGSRGACMINEYSDKPGWHGFLLKDTTYYKQVIKKLYDSKFQVCTHAIGDSGNRTILKIYADVLKGKNDRRWRIEHAQVINENDFHFFGDYNIIPSVQPTHATSDMYWAAQRVGPTVIKGAYAYQQLLQQNQWIPLGTDFPVEDISPFKTFYAAVTRQDSKGFPPGGFQMENALSREQAMRGITIWAARSGFEENKKGSLEAGKFADFIIIDKDLMYCAPMEILEAKIISSFINGEIVYKKSP